jgi:hypothetical protein
MPCREQVLLSTLASGRNENEVIFLSRAGGEVSCVSHTNFQMRDMNDL